MNGTAKLPRRGLLGAGGALLAAPALGQAPEVPPLAVMEVVGAGLILPLLRDFVAANAALAGAVALHQIDVDDIAQGLADDVASGNSGIDLVFAGDAGIMAGIMTDTWQSPEPWALEGLAPLETLVTPAAMAGWRGSHGMAVPILAGPGGPLLGARPGRPAQLPRSPAELLDWARQNPQRFLYARPPVVTSGRLFLRALPSLLGDADPSKPRTGWEKTWSYLEELDRYIDYYPTSMVALAEEVAEDSCDLLMLSVAGDLELRVAGLLPADLMVQPFEGQAWAVASIAAAIPRDLPADRRPVVRALIRHLLSPSVQASLLFGRGADPAARIRLDVEGSALGAMPASGLPSGSVLMAPRPGLQALLADARLLPPIAWEDTVEAGRIWDQRIGAMHGLR